LELFVVMSENWNPDEGRMNQARPEAILVTKASALDAAYADAQRGFAIQSEALGEDGGIRLEIAPDGEGWYTVTEDETILSSWWVEECGAIDSLLVLGLSHVQTALATSS